MGIPEPSSPLWMVVKAIYDSWPPDDEVVAQQLGNVWRRGAGELAKAATGTADAGTAAHAAWMDHAGTSFKGRLGEAGRKMDELQQQMHAVGARGDRYAQELVTAKTAITTTIAANEANYALLAGPMFGAMGPALQQGFATQIAHSLQAMIAQKAAALGSGDVPMAPPPVPVPRPTPPAPAPQPPADDGGWSWSDIGHGILDGIGLAPGLGEWADGLNAAWYAAEGDLANAALSGAAMVPFIGWGATGIKAARALENAADAAQAARPATSATAGSNLNQSLASESQMYGPGVPIAGAGHHVPVRAADRLAEAYGGTPGDWTKMSSKQYASPDGRTFETHWYENSQTGERVEPKTKLVDEEKLARYERERAAREQQAGTGG